MHVKACIVVGFGLALLSITGCTICTPPDLCVDETADGTQVTREVGQRLIIVLPAQTIPFTWYLVQEFDTVIENTNRTYLAPNLGLLGSRGSDRWEFTARGAGTVTLQFELRPVLGGAGDAIDTFEITVAVTPATT